MIFYGDVSTEPTTRDVIAGIGAAIESACALPPGIDRHAAWVTALIASGELVQGLADATLENDGVDDAGEPEQAGLALAVVLARIMGRSWDSGFEPENEAATPAFDALHRLAALDGLPSSLAIRRPEGYAHYAVYPEAYWEAAMRPGPKPRHVVGIRSIGTSLASTVAAAVNVPFPLTLRPLGHPFSRETRPGGRLAETMRRGSGEVWAIVDEGPGLSGSSFTAVADRLIANGTPTESLVLFPSHLNLPGAMTTEDRRRFWSIATRRVTGFDDLVQPVAGRRRGLAAWIGDITGTPRGDLVDIAGGAWRAVRFADETAWPAADRQNERRKYLVAGPRGTYLLKFTGLGAFGREKMARAKALAAAGFTLEPLAWRHGFLVEPWRADTSAMMWRDQDRNAFLSHLARYLGFRARAFPASRQAGASLDVLWAMAKANATEAIGQTAADRLDGWRGRLRDLAPWVRPVAIDGKLDAHEWLVDGRGRWIKTDALDHCCGHDLVGCQDIAWDVAGAAVTFGLSDREAERLRRDVEGEARAPCHPGLVAFFRIAFAAFRIATFTLARAREEGAEAARLDEAVAAAVAALRREIRRPSAAL